MEIMVLICHVILQDHLTKGSSSFMGRSPSRDFAILSNVVAIGAVVMENNSFNLSGDPARPSDEMIN